MNDDDAPLHIMNGALTSVACRVEDAPSPAVGAGGARWFSLNYFGVRTLSLTCQLDNEP